MHLAASSTFLPALWRCDYLGSRKLERSWLCPVCVWCKFVLVSAATIAFNLLSSNLKLHQAGWGGTQAAHPPVSLISVIGRGISLGSEPLSVCSCFEEGRVWRWDCLKDVCKAAFGGSFILIPVLSWEWEHPHRSTGEGLEAASSSKDKQNKGFLISLLWVAWLLCAFSVTWNLLEAGGAGVDVKRYLMVGNQSLLVRSKGWACQAF